MSDQERPDLIDPSYPKRDAVTTGGEYATAALSTAANYVVPFSGTAAGAILKRYVQLPLDQRRTAWFERVGQALYDLQVRLKGFDPSKLDSNEHFISAVYETLHIAMRTSSEEKREALCNAVLNTAASSSFDEVIEGAFIGLIDRFSSTHLYVLRIFDNPTSLAAGLPANSELVGNIKDVCTAQLEQKGFSEEALTRVYADLEREDMIATNYSANISSGRTSSSVLKPAGLSFLRFISKPI